VGMKPRAGVRWVRCGDDHYVAESGPILARVQSIEGECWDWCVSTAFQIMAAGTLPCEPALFRGESKRASYRHALAAAKRRCEAVMRRRA